jgi:hypothetical protein
MAGESDAETSEESSGNNETEDQQRRKLSKKEQADLLRRQVDTVGRTGKPEEKIQSVISVGCSRKDGTQSPSLTSWVFARSRRSCCASRSWDGASAHLL